MAVVIIDPLLRGFNDHHWNQIKCCVDHCRKASLGRPVLYFPSDIQLNESDEYSVRLSLSRPQYSAYNEFPLADYVRFLVWYAEALKPSLQRVYAELGPESDLIIPNSALPLVYALLSTADKIPPLKSLRIFNTQSFIPDEPGLGVQLMRSLQGRLHALAVAKKTLLAIPHKSYSDIESSLWSFWGENNKTLWASCRPVFFQPITSEVLGVELRTSAKYDLVFFGHVDELKNDFSGLGNLLEQGLSICFCAPERTTKADAFGIIQRLRQRSVDGRFELLLYNDLSSGEFVRLASHGNFVYLVSNGDYYDVKGGYSNRVLEMLVVGKPMIASGDAFSNIPFIDLNSDAILSANSYQLQSADFCRHLCEKIKKGHDLALERAVGRRSFWRATLIEFGFEQVLFADF
jgi:hypothetical protein